MDHFWRVAMQYDDENIKVSRESVERDKENIKKYENFDVYDLSAGISNSITDQLYRQYLPIIEEEYRKRKLEGKDRHLENDLEVNNLVGEIKDKVEEKLKDEVSSLVVQQVVKELGEQYHSEEGSNEERMDNYIKIIRYLIFPSFICVGLVLLAFNLVIFAEMTHMLAATWDFLKEAWFTVDVKVIKESLNNLVASILSILDLLLIGSLMIMVLVGVYENTVSRIGISHSVPTWFGKLDIAQLKIKVAASIIIISSVHLLMSFMQLDLLHVDKRNYEELKWTSIIHGLFVLSGIGLAYMDYIYKLGRDSKS